MPVATGGRQAPEEPTKLRCFLILPLIAWFTAALALQPANAEVIDKTHALLPVDPKVDAALARLKPLLSFPNSESLRLPGNPQQALVDETSSLSAMAGFPEDGAHQIHTAGFPDQIAGRLANVIAGLANCHRITSKHFLAIRHNLAHAVVDGTGLDPPRFTGIRRCAFALWARTADLERTVKAMAGGAGYRCGATAGRKIDIWPVLRVEGGCLSNTYRNDYMLTLDLGGNDRYINNVGSNMIDVNFSPPKSVVQGLRGTGPAQGCQRAIPGLAAGDCIPSASVLLDMQGSDTFGVKQLPDIDRGCTNDPVVRRMVTGGAGLLGVGILRDAGISKDRYTGKTGSLGAGHVFGVGMLSDNGGNDVYRSVRNSQGFALSGGVGILSDSSGDDTYDYYMPSPIDPSAPNQAEGAGGVRDDEGGGLCDRIPRFVQGAANVMPDTTGILLEGGGSDRYHGVFVESFIAPGQFPSTRAGSLGFGNNQALGVFIDRENGLDSYRVDGEPVVPGVPSRGNNQEIPPGNPSTGDGGGSGLFVDS